MTVNSICCASPALSVSNDQHMSTHEYQHCCSDDINSTGSASGAHTCCMHNIIQAQTLETAAAFGSQQEVTSGAHPEHRCQDLVHTMTRAGVQFTE